MTCAMVIGGAGSTGAPVATSVHLTILALPPTPLLGRVSDDRVGYFETSYQFLMLFLALFLLRYAFDGFQALVFAVMFVF